ncbi:MAG: type II toxin-antitoxin system RelE/ParE family toxin [Deltaproteobacteria bacterium]|nr:type II toxin-antitoxin system RelE/ParE family toxin [Deltaproteobacteria bacterium]
MNYSLKIKSSAAKEIKNLPKQDKTKIIEAIDSLKTQPHVGTLLKGQFTGLRRIRVGHYRVIYEVRDTLLVILVLKIGHRLDVYR